MIDNQKQDDLRLLYKCFVRREANLKCIVEELKRFIKDEGAKITSDDQNLKNAIKMVDSLLEFQDNMQK